MSKFWHTEEEVEASLENYGRVLDQKEEDLKFFLTKQFKHMTLEVQALLDGVQSLDSKVDTLRARFADQQSAINTLNTTVAGLTLSDADKATLAAATKAVADETAAVDATLNPPIGTAAPATNG